MYLSLVNSYNSYNSYNFTLLSQVFQCDEQTLPCDHTTKFRTMTGWCNNLDFPEYGKSVRAFTRLLAPAYDDQLMSPRSRLSNPSIYLYSYLYFIYLFLYIPT